MKITGFGISPTGEINVKVEDAEGQSLREVLGSCGVKLEGNVPIINGRRLTEAEAKAATVKDTDTVAIQPAPKAGR